MTPFNPSNYFETITIKDIMPKLEDIKGLNFKEVSLNNELMKYNYEIFSPEYEDFMYKTLEEYGEFEVDTIV